VELFGRHVFRRSPRLLRRHARRAPHLTGKAKVSERCLPFGIEQDIAGLDVTMN
jgi:hypothetical protein